MWREVSRVKQSLSREECVSILKTELRGVLSVVGDGGYPYCTPINHYYREQDGKIYFHCGKKGHRNDALANSDKVCLCVYDRGYKKDGEWALNIKSVVVFGRARPVSHEKALEICRELCRKFTDDEKYVEEETEKYGSLTEVYEITPEHITGKTVKEA
ncbi:MAG: pyridoxamine 5'-phosphate oxidase family protein [Clostridia bacterium]|nr:pyridoxamine 5'-phosphate oxidase family protein [Clostridia bacterium]